MHYLASEDPTARLKGYSLTRVDNTLGRAEDI